LLTTDSTSLSLPSASYDQALVFFLLHERPALYRGQMLSELLSVVIIIGDYGLLRWWHPLPYIWRPC
jgi:hypothetical protein